MEQPLRHKLQARGVWSFKRLGKGLERGWKTSQAKLLRGPGAEGSHVERTACTTGCGSMPRTLVIQERS